MGLLKITTLVIPCYNESKRLVPGAFVAVLKKSANLRFVFVNDGSTDDTLTMINAINEVDPSRVETLNLSINSGKAEAVRLGILCALKSGSEYVGYWDADLATPIEIAENFCRVLDSTDVDMVMGSRVRLLGRRIERNTTRHYLGRAFATCASLLLDIGVYDTQCGAKLFRKTALVSQVFEKPFRVNWIFDVEMLARFIILSGRTPSEASSRWMEYPLDEWVDIRGSKIKNTDFFRAGFEFVKLWFYLKTARRHYKKYLTA